MTTERLGIAIDLAQKREAVASRLSPAARHRAFPTVYARPLPALNKNEKQEEENTRLKARVATLTAKVAELVKENQALTLRNGQLAQQCAGMNIEPPQAGEFVRRRPIVEVIEAFCQILNSYGFRVDEELWTVDHMRCDRRSRNLARPRQVCMWVCIKVCSHASLPALGHAFGGRDHTTIMNGRDKAPDVMHEAPLLAQVARETMDRFRVNGTGEKPAGGAP